MDSTLGNNSYNHHQVVIIVDYDDGRLFPLTEEIPKCLLPVANRKILGYQLDMLQSCGATEVFIATPHEYHAQLSLFISEEYHSSSSAMGIEIVSVPDMLGSADALRAVSHRIRGDFLVINSDVVSQINLGVLINTHRLKTADVTMMLSSVQIEEAIEMNKKAKGGSSSGSGGKAATAVVKPAKIDEEDQEFIGICDDGRVMVKTPALEIDDDSHVSFSKAMVHKSCGGGSGGKMRFRCDLIDTGVYCMAFWILEFLAKRKTISTIRTDLLPYLVQRQYQSSSYLFQNIPGLEHRKRGLQVLEPWLVQTRATSESFVIPGLAFNATPAPPCLQETALRDALSCSNVTEMAATCFLTPLTPGLKPCAKSSVPSSNDSDRSSLRSESLSQDHCGSMSAEGEDLLRCFAVLVESPPEMSPYPVICQRVTNFQTYLGLNSFFPFASVPVHNPKSPDVCKWFCPWVPYAGSQVSASNSNTIMKKEQSLVGEGICLGDSVTLKSCTVGKHCKIGVKSKLNQSVLMRGVQIGDNCTIQNCIISDNAVIGNGCSLKHCYVGPNVTLKDGSSIKSETISSSTITE